VVLLSREKRWGREQLNLFGPISTSVQLTHLSSLPSPPAPLSSVQYDPVSHRDCLTLAFVRRLSFYWAFHTGITTTGKPRLYLCTTESRSDDNNNYWWRG